MIIFENYKYIKSNPKIYKICDKLCDFVKYYSFIFLQLFQFLYPTLVLVDIIFYIFGLVALFFFCFF